MAGERDLLGAQLVRRNDELALLYHKTRLQQAALAQARTGIGCLTTSMLVAHTSSCHTRDARLLRAALAWAHAHRLSPSFLEKLCWCQPMLAGVMRAACHTT